MTAEHLRQPGECLELPMDDSVDAAEPCGARHGSRAHDRADRVRIDQFLEVLDLAVDVVEQRRVRIDQYVEHRVQQLVPLNLRALACSWSLAELERLLGCDRDEVVGRVDDVDLDELSVVDRALRRRRRRRCTRTLVLLDLRALIELLEVFDRERVQTERGSGFIEMIVGDAS